MCADEYGDEEQWELEHVQYDIDDYSEGDWFADVHDDNWDDFYIPTRWELVRDTVHARLRHYRHCVLMVISKRYRDHINDIPF